MSAAEKLRALEQALREMRDASPQSWDWYQGIARRALEGQTNTEGPWIVDPDSTLELGVVHPKDSGRPRFRIVNPEEERA